MRKKIIKALLATLVLTATSTSIGFVNNSTEAKAFIATTNYPDGTGGVWNSAVVKYLSSFGYTGIVIYNIDQYGNRSCTSSNHPNAYTNVYVSGGAIIGHEDFPSGIML